MTNTEIMDEFRMIHGVEGEILTFNLWKNKGYKVNKGEKAYDVQLWKKVKIKVADDKEKSKFILVNCKMFTSEQVTKR